MAHKIIREALPKLKKQRDCQCKDALKHALITDPKTIPAETKERLKPIIGKYIK